MKNVFTIVTSMGIGALIMRLYDEQKFKSLILEGYVKGVEVVLDIYSKRKENKT